MPAPDERAGADPGPRASAPAGAAPPEEAPARELGAPVARGARLGWLLVPLLALPLLGMVLSTTRDPWVTPDGYSYVIGGANLARGAGYVDKCVTHEARCYVTHWPPLLASLVAVGVRAGLHPITAGLLLVGLGWMALVLATYLLGIRLGSRGAALAAAAVVAASAEVFSWGHMVLTDIPFAALTTWILGITVHRLERRSFSTMTALMVGAGLAAAAMLRYVGVVFLVPALYVVWRVVPTWRRRAGLAALTGGIPCLALGLWLGRNLVVAHSLVGERPDAVLPLGKALGTALAELGQSLLQTLVPGARLAFPGNLAGYPGGGPAEWGSVAGWVLVLAAVALAVRRLELPRRWRPVLLAAGAYCLALVGAKARGGFSDPLVGRFVLPLLPLVLLAAFGVAARGPRVARGLLAVATALLVAANGLSQVGIGAWYARAHYHPNNYRHSALHSLAFFAQLRRDYGHCLRYTTELHREVPSYRLSRFLSGWCLQATGHPRAALREYEVAARYVPSYAQTYLNMGFALQALGEPAEAEAAFARGRALQGRGRPTPLEAPAPPPR